MICASEDARKGYLSLFGAEPEALVLGNVIDDEEIHHKAEEPLSIQKKDGIKYFLAVGRLTWQKGFDKLIEVFAKLRDEKYPIHLWILGEGPERKNLEQLIAQYQLKGVVDLMGFQDNPYPYMKAADCVVCSSRYEGISTVVTEALILGKPVVTTPCTGMEELLGNSEYGLIADSTENGLYEALKEMTESENLEMYYADAAKVRGQDFSSNKRIRQTEKFLKDSLKFISM